MRGCQAGCVSSGNEGMLSGEEGGVGGRTMMQEEAVMVKWSLVIGMEWKQLLTGWRKLRRREQLG